MKKTTENPNQPDYRPYVFFRHQFFGFFFCANLPNSLRFFSEPVLPFPTPRPFADLNSAADDFFCAFDPVLNSFFPDEPPFAFYFLRFSISSWFAFAFRFSVAQRS
jgi:hypothetical protein